MSVTKTTDAAGRARWVARWRDPGQRNPRRRTFDRKIDADRFLATMATDRLRGTYLDPDAGMMTVREFADEHWLPNALLHVRPNTLSTYTQHLQHHVLPEFGDTALIGVKRDVVQNWVGRLRRSGLKPSTIGTVVAVLRMVLQAAVDEERIPKNVAARLSLPQVMKHPVTPLTAAQVMKLAEVITPRYRLAVILGVGAGLREGEVLGLTDARVDFLRRRALYVEMQAQGGKLVEVKTRASKAWVPVDDAVLTEITAHIARFGVGPDGVLIRNRCGRIVQRGSFGTCWREAVIAAGLPTGTRFHDLRHTYASVQIAQGKHPKVIQALMRHATMAETMDTYGHLFPDDDGAGRGAVDAFFGALSDTTATPQVQKVADPPVPR